MKYFGAVVRVVFASVWKQVNVSTMAIQKSTIEVMSSAIEHVINARLLEDDMTGVREDWDGSGGRRGGWKREEGD